MLDESVLITVRQQLCPVFGCIYTRVHITIIKILMKGRKMKSNTTRSAIFLAALLSFNQANAESENTSNSIWDGQYIGFTAGASKGEADPSVNVKLNGYFVGTDPDQINPEASSKMDSTDLSGSFLWGLNHQSGNTVYGLEVDVSYSGYDEEHKSGDITYLTAPPSGFALTTNVKSDWAVSLRPRIGFIHNKSLFYISAGPSVRKFEYDYNFTDTFQPQLVNVNESDWKVGWVASLGYETQIKDAFILRAEYQYSSYKDIVDTQSTTVGYPDDGFTHKLDFSEQSLRIGILKKF